MVGARLAHLTVGLALLAIGLSGRAEAQSAPRAKPAAAARAAAPGPQAPLDRQVFPFYPLQTAWTTNTGVPPPTASATDGLHLYVPSSSGELNVFSVATGSALFSRPYPSALAPVVGDGRLLITGDKVIDAFKPDDVTPLWKAPLPAAAVFPPVVRGGWVFVAQADGALAGLRGDSGKVVWSVPTGAARCAPVVEGDRLYATGAGGTLHALAVEDGRTAWRTALDSDATAVAAIPGHVFVATSGRWLYALDAAKGQVRWRFRIQGAAIGLTVDDDRVIAVMLDQAVRAFKIGSGAQAWRQELSFRPAGGPLVVGESVLVTGFAPSVRVLNRKTGASQGLYALPLPVDASGISLETLSAGPLLAYGPTLFDDVIILVTQHGFLHAARRLFDPPATPLTALPGLILPVPEPPAGWVAPPTPADGTTTTAPASPAPAKPGAAPTTTPTAPPAKPGGPPAPGGTPPRRRPAPPAR